jgi:hypothetical protein
MKEKEMNFTGEHTLPGLGRRINWHLVTLVLGIALAVSIVITAGALDRAGQTHGDVTAQPVNTVPASSRPATEPRSVLYIVGSELDGIAFEQVTYEAGHEAPGIDRRVLVADSAEDEGLVLTAIGEAMQGGHFDVVDLRK